MIELSLEMFVMFMHDSCDQRGHKASQEHDSIIELEHNKINTIEYIYLVQYQVYDGFLLPRPRTDEIFQSEEENSIKFWFLKTV